MRIIDLRQMMQEKQAGAADLRVILRPYLNRRDEADQELERKVADILQTVRRDGDAALRAYTEQFDRVTVEADELRVTPAEMAEAVRETGAEFRQILEQAYAQIKTYHQLQVQETWTQDVRPGVVLGQKITPLDRVGVYVPGGTAGYPSTVLMTVIPALVAGVGSIAMVSPPNREGKIDPVILTAAAVCGVDEIYKVGGAQAVAALAYGTERIAAVDKIVGPGNRFVATAKKQVFGTVGIDLIAGPSEIGILAGPGNNPAFAAADLLSQAEHDVRAAAVLVTEDADFAQAVAAEVDGQKKKLARNAIVEQSLADYGLIFVVPSREAACDLINEIAPEHLEIMWSDADDYLPKIKHAGAIFLGSYTPEPVGDYFAGPNHTLPTSGTARFSSPLGVYDYIKRSSIIRYSETAFRSEADAIIEFASREGLSAHAEAIRIRKQERLP